MNPTTWKRQHQVALILATILGIPFGIFFGYVIHAIG